MTDISDFFPLFDKDEEAVYAEMVARANEGVQPDDPAYVDTRVGSFFYLTNYPVAVGIAAAYSRMNEAAAAGIVATAWETYLDLHAESYGTERKVATLATGTVRFSGDPGSLIPSGTRVLVPRSDPDIDPPGFETTASGTLNAVVGPVSDVGQTATLAAGGTLTLAQNYRYTIVAVDDEGFEGVKPLGGTEPNATPSGGNRSIALAWTAVAGAFGYHIYRSTGAGYSRLNLPIVTVPTYTDAGATTVPGVPSSVNASGGRRSLPVRALESGATANVAAGAISQLDAGVAGVTAVTNLTAMTGGTEVESDPALKERLVQRFEGAKGANKAWYAARALEEPGVARATVIANWDGDGTVLVIVMDEDGRDVGTDVVASLQARLDPDPGEGDGEAPIDHEVTVATPTVKLVNVRATPVFKPGYSLDGDSGTVSIRSELDAAVREYIDHLTSGDDVIYNAVEAAYFTVEGLLNVTGLQTEFQVGGTWAATDLAIAVSPAEVAASNFVLFI